MRHNTSVNERLELQRRSDEATVGRLALPEGASVCRLLEDLIKDTLCV